MQTQVKKKTALYGTVAIILALTISSVAYNFNVLNPSPSPQPQPQPQPQPNPQNQVMSRFTSYDQLVNYIQSNLKPTNHLAYFNSPWRFSWGVPTTSTTAFFESLTLATSFVLSDAPDKSQTNTQVAGVEEPDIVKTDGTFLYVVSNSTLFILKAYPPEDATILSQIKFNGTLQEFFVNGDKLAIVGNTGVSFIYPMGYTYYKPSTFVDDKTHIEVFDIANRSSPVLARNFSISGNYFDSRMINDYVYLVASQPAYLLYDTLVLPKLYSESGMKEIDASQIYFANVTDYSYAFTTILAVNVQNDAQEPTHETLLLGAASIMYVSLDNIYITFWTQDGGTLIYRMSIDNDVIKTEATGKVPGSVLNQFSMDEYNGYFRLATTTAASWLNGTTTQNNLYVLDMNLSMVGKIEGIAPGESIYSVRFMGDRGYVVTFRQIDPFFALDLTNPAEPKVLGVLKIPGYSSYLHPYDENHIIGIGKDAGNVKISLFDVTNASNPVELGNYQIGSADTPVLYDHKALLFDASKDLLLMPVSVYEYSPLENSTSGSSPPVNSTNGLSPLGTSSYWQGVYVFNITIQGGIVFKGRVTQMSNATSPPVVILPYPNTYTYVIKRALYIDNVLYTVSDRRVMMNDLQTLQEINQIDL